jgi:tetratricopeptide (TPR) repeat protein
MPGPSKRRGRRLWIIAACVAVLLLLAWAYANKWFGLAARPPAARTSIAVLGFQDLSGGPNTAALSQAVSAGLTAEIGIGRGLRVISGEQAARLELDLNLSPTRLYSRHALSLIHQNTGASLIVWGRYAASVAPGQTGHVLLNIFIENVNSGNIAASIQRDGNANDLPALIVASAADLRAKLGLPEWTRQEQPFTRTVLPSSSGALTLYAAGLEDLYTWKYEAACGLFEKVIASDSSYAPARAALARALWERGYTQQAISEVRTALNLSHTLPPEQRLLVESEYYEIESEWSKALDVYRNLFGSYPDNIDYGLSVAGLEHGSEALQTIEALRRLPLPLRADPRIDSQKAKIELDLHDYPAARLAAEAAVIKARERSAQAVLANALLIQGHAERMLAQRPRAVALYREARSIARILGDRLTQTTCTRSLADIALETGELTVAATGYSQALEVGRSVASLRIVASSAAGLGHVRLEQGNLAQADRYLEQSLDLMRQQQSYLDIPIEETYLGELFLRRGELQKSSQFISGALNALANTRGRAEIEALNALARVRLEQGNLAAAFQTVNEALQIANELSDKYPLARVLLLAGRVARERAALNQARQQYAKALAIFSKLGIGAGVAEARLGIAHLDLAEHDAAAASLARNARVDFQREDRISRAFAARAIEAQADLTERRTAAAEAVLRPALRQNIQDRLVADLVRTVAARIQAANGRRARAIAELNAVIADTSRLGLIRDRFEAELALAAIQPSNPATAHLASEAAHNGFTEIANRASALRPPDDARVP